MSEAAKKAAAWTLMPLTICQDGGPDHLAHSPPHFPSVEPGIIECSGELGAFSGASTIRGLSGPGSQAERSFERTMTVS